MIRYLSDHCFDEDLLRAVTRADPSINFVLARQVGLARAPDPEVLSWAAREGRVVITHDRNTMISFALRRIEEHAPMAGLVVVRRRGSFSRIVEDILLLSASTQPADWQNRIEYVPL